MQKNSYFVASCPSHLSFFGESIDKGIRGCYNKEAKYGTNDAQNQGCG